MVTPHIHNKGQYNAVRTENSTWQKAMTVSTPPKGVGHMARYLFLCRGFPSRPIAVVPSWFAYGSFTVPSWFAYGSLTVPL